LKTHLKKWFYFLSFKKVWMGMLVFLLLLFIGLSFFQRQQLNTWVDASTLLEFETQSYSSQYTLPLYREKVLTYERFGYEVNENEHDVELIGTSLLDYPEVIESFNLSDSTTGKVIDVDHPVEWVHALDEPGLYYVQFNYVLIDSTIDQAQFSLTINGEHPFLETQVMTLPSVWSFDTLEFTQDRYGNDIQPVSNQSHIIQSTLLRDYKGAYLEPFMLYLEKGDVVSLGYANTRMLIDDLKYINYENAISYENYINMYQNEAIVDTLQMVSAKDISFRSDPQIRLRTEQDPASMYYDTQFLRLNTIFGESWQNGGGQVAYEVTVETSGLYALSFKYRQYLIKDLPVFRKITINGEVPFEELNYVAFPHTMNFMNRTIQNDSGTPLYVYLEKGTHTIMLEATYAPYANAIETMKYVMSEIQTLSLDIKRYTSGGTDRYRDWDVAFYFPNAENQIRSWIVMLENVYDDLLLLTDDDNPSEIANLLVSMTRLKDIADDINSLPSKMVQFSDGDASVNQMLGQMVAQFMRANLELERIMIHGEVKTPAPFETIFVRLFESTKRLVLSFINNPYSIENNEEDINVWVNYPRQYIEIMQVLIDQAYEGDRKVTLSQMPDQNKLILANTSGQAPDVVLGVDHWIPYEFAIRGASIDLRTFEGYEALVSHFSPGAMIPYAFEEGIFGLPSTQNFWVTYYRKDILSSIGMTDIPETWDEVIEALPLLQSYGLNYFVPLAQYSGLKPYVATIPFVYQFGGELYTEDGMQTGINGDQTVVGMELMSNLFTLYNMPKFVGNFYNSFRYGTLPIGISDLATYILLSSAATELEGLWDMALHPGVYNEATNTIERYASVGAQANMILSQTQYEEEAWDFLSWWMSTEVQSEFALTLLSTYGKQYVWNTANLEAFQTIPIPQNYKDIIFEQWQYAIEAPRIPGSYMVEREISNAWTAIVFDAANPRQALDEAVRIANREISYKMAEFDYDEIGYYKVPTLDNIHEWLTEVHHD
jgi:ABC-type glycerol-3-phosphate transport system substrate-binding protein